MKSVEDQFEIQKELLELAIKSGRRLMHDFSHMLNDVPPSCIWKQEYEERAKIWHDIFYPDNGIKNYRAELHKNIRDLNSEISRLQNLLEKHGIDYSPDTPF